jgi:hypothetical protein
MSAPKAVKRRKSAKVTRLIEFVRAALRGARKERKG